MATNLKSLVGKSITKKAKFCGEDITIKKLSVAQVMELQEKFKSLDNDESSLEILKLVIRHSADGGDELSDEDFKGFPIEELSNLSNEILKFSGLGNVAPQQG